jgi:hypothetical protein
MMHALLAAAPADKSQQMSDWSARPLTDRQQRYAALDAFVLVQLFGVLKERLGPETTQQLVQQHTKTINRVSGLSKVTLPLGQVEGQLCFLSRHGKQLGQATSCSKQWLIAGVCCTLTLPTTQCCCVA